MNGTARTVVSDDSDESNGQTLRASCSDGGVGDKSRGRFAGMKEDLRSNQHTAIGIASDESNSRDNRCSVSNLQQPEQPVTPVLQSGSVGPTVVNIQDVDECLVTNKHTNVKHDCAFQ